ncbi:hypothetical protein Lal_00027609 [Lupinus albus]|nr:hypothetical protein Lal_00027609 [Lupinus albus]
MACCCKGFWECLLKLLNFILTLTGLAMVGYGIYLLVEFTKASDDTPAFPPIKDDGDLIQLGRPMLMAVSLSDSIVDKLPKAWFIYLFIGIGVVLFVISCFGCIGAVTRSGCCLSCPELKLLFRSQISSNVQNFFMSSSVCAHTCINLKGVIISFLKSTKYSVLVVLLILVELGCAAFIFFDKSWQKEIPTDKTGSFDMIYGFLRENWNLVKWVALGIVIFEVSSRWNIVPFGLHSLAKIKAVLIPIDVREEYLLKMSPPISLKVLNYHWKERRAYSREGFVHALLFFLAIIVRAANRPADYDSDDEYINPRQQARQPLLHKPEGPATGIPVTGTIDQRPSRNDAWSTRMREKYGLDTSEFTYNPSESQRNQQVNSQPTEERSGCIIM